jgi:hypothetical protein
MSGKKRKDAPRGSRLKEPKRRRKRPGKGGGRPYPPGTSGNPSRQFGVPETGNPINRLGVPRSARELAALAQEHGAQVLEELASVALTGFGRDEAAEVDEEGRPMRRRLIRAAWSDRIRASDLVLERGFGRAPQPITGPDGGPVTVDDISRLTTNERNRRLEELLRLAEVPPAPAPIPEATLAEASSAAASGTENGDGDGPGGR